MEAYRFDPIGVLHTCFKEKFGIPRQPGLVTGAQGTIKLGADPLLRTALRELEGFSHLWVIFVFHDQGLGAERTWKPSIRPPRLGGARKVGVLASRSPHRPNPIGLSAVKLERIDLDAPGGVEIHVSGVDVLDGTPVLDIKPYLPYADSIADASAGWAAEPIERVDVEFDETALRAIELRGGSGKAARYPRLREMIVEMLSLDPRPAFQKRRMPAGAPEAQGTRYGFRLFEFDVKWEIRDGRFAVLDVVEFGAGGAGTADSAEAAGAAGD
jgi:tRNA-Thr(GGU) m(6)t(6)A37 methyltransferase TsaA